jgi:hypothetical protein
LIIVADRFAPYQLQHAHVFFACFEVARMIGVLKPDEMLSLGRALSAMH